MNAKISNLYAMRTDFHRGDISLLFMDKSTIVFGFANRMQAQKFLALFAKVFDPLKIKKPEGEWKWNLGNPLTANNVALA